MDIYFYEAFKDEADALGSLLGRDFDYEFAPETIQETGHTAPPARLISIRTQSKIPTAWADALDGILSRSTGYDHLIAYSAEVRKTLPLGYLDEYATRAVAEHAMMLAMALLRKLPRQIRQFPFFRREDMTGCECLGKNLLVVGVGRIGREIVQVGNGLGFVVRGVDIVPDKPGVDYVSKEEGIPWADVIICAMNLTEDNAAYFNYELLQRVKTGCVFVNIARGEHSPLPDLERLLREGRIAGLGLDVFDDEGDLAVTLRNPGHGTPGRADLVRTLLAYPNVLLTPHNAFNSREALQRKAAYSVEQIRHFFRQGDFIWKV
jgi:D-lactate dehydrogenase